MEFINRCQVHWLVQLQGHIPAPIMGNDKQMINLQSSRTLSWYWETFLCGKTTEGILTDAKSHLFIWLPQSASQQLHEKYQEWLKSKEIVNNP